MKFSRFYFTLCGVLSIILCFSSCRSMQHAPKSVEAVDLGLTSGTKWATCNVGASSPEEIGSYFAWGETKKKKEYSLKTYFDAHYEKFTVDGYNCISGTKYDVATTSWGAEWAMPTAMQAYELYVECQWTWTENYKSTGVAGMICTGPNGNHIFFPSGGLIMGREHSYTDYGNYWTGSLERYNNIDWANFIDFNNRGLTLSYLSRDHRYWGRNIRPVKK